MNEYVQLTADGHQSSIAKSSGLALLQLLRRHIREAIQAVSQRHAVTAADGLHIAPLPVPGLTPDHGLAGAGAEPEL